MMTDSTLGILGWIVTYVPARDDTVLPEYEVRHLDDRKPRYSILVLGDGFDVNEHDGGEMTNHGTFAAKPEAFARVGELVIAGDCAMATGPGGYSTTPRKPGKGSKGK